MIVNYKLAVLRVVSAGVLLALTSLPVAAHQAVSTQPVVVNSTPVTVAGTVTELVVKNQLTGDTLRYFGLKLDQGGSYALTGTSSSQRPSHRCSSSLR